MNVYRPLPPETEFRSDANVVIAAPFVDERATLTRAMLADAMRRRIGFSLHESGRLLEMLLVEIGDALTRNENVKLPGFGSFHVRPKRERVGRNPKTGVDAKIEARNVLIFKPSALLSQRLNVS